MKTRQQLEKAMENAERRYNEWYDKYEWELYLHKVNVRGDMVSLLYVFEKEYRRGFLSADIVESSGLTVYEKDNDDEDYGVYHECTRRVIKNLRRMERKMEEWSDKYYLLECAVDSVNADGTPYRYCENNLADINRKLAALGVSI